VAEHLDGGSAGRGAVVLLGGQWTKYALQLVSFVVLARLLDPADFGLLTMTMSVVGVATVVGDFGLSLAAIQSPTLSQKEKSNLFWLNCLIGLGTAALAAVSGPFLASFYDEPVVALIAPALAVIFLANGISTQAKVELNRTHRFGQIALSDVVGQLIAFALAIAGALAGLGVWALVLQSIAGPVIAAGLAIAWAKWIPSWWSRGTSVRKFVRFGAYTFFVQVVNYGTSNVDSVVVGSNSGPATLGIYSRAYQLVSLPIQQLVSPLTRVALPYLSRFATMEDGAHALQLAANRVQSILAFILIGALSLLASTAAPLIDVFLGNDWAAAAPLLQILAVGAVFQCLGYVYYWLFLAKAATHLLFLSELPGRLIMVVGIVIAGPFGPGWVAVAASVGQVIIWLTGTIFFVRRLDVSALSLVKASWGQAGIYVIAFGVGFAVQLATQEWLSVAQLIVTMGAWLLTTLSLYVLVPPMREVLVDFVKLAKRVARR
jgi:PST family polysaccharide transporter